jgi:hypothetical protein
MEAVSFVAFIVLSPATWGRQPDRITGGFQTDARREAASQVAVRERLQLRRVDVAAVVDATHRPDLIEQQTERPLAHG